MSLLTFYGLKSCDTCRKAQKELAAAGLAFDPVDVRADGVSRDKLAHWLEVVGAAKLINRKSTTWRGLSDDQKYLAQEGDPLELLLENPTLIKRPVIESDGAVLVGWDKDTKAILGL